MRGVTTRVVLLSSALKKYYQEVLHVRIQR
jgi:hypothetical protein